MREVIEGTTTGDGAYNAWLASMTKSSRNTGEKQHIEKQPFEAAITKISVDMFVELRILSKRGQTAKLKSKLREYITMMEDLYERI